MSTFDLNTLATLAALPHLAAPLAAVTTAAALLECLESEGRVQLLQLLKDHGVSKIGERQALANALGKARRQGIAPDATTGAPMPRPRVGLVHGGCSNSWIFRQQLKPLLEALAEEVELVDLQGGLLSEEVRFDERGRQQMLLLHKAFGDDQVLREHAVTCYDESGAFYYDRLMEGIENLEAQLRGLPTPLDALVGFSQGANLSTMLSARSVHRKEGAAPAFRALVLLENDPPAWPKQMPEVFAVALPTAALLVGGQALSPKTDEVGRLYARPEHARHADGHRPLPKDPAARAELVQRICSFIRVNTNTVC